MVEDVFCHLVPDLLAKCTKNYKAFLLCSAQNFALNELPSAASIFGSGGQSSR